MGRWNCRRCHEQCRYISRHISRTQNPRYIYHPGGPVCEREAKTRTDVPPTNRSHTKVDTPHENHIDARTQTLDPCKHTGPTKQGKNSTRKMIDFNTHSPHDSSTVSRFVRVNFYTKNKIRRTRLRGSGTQAPSPPALSGKQSAR